VYKIPKQDLNSNIAFLLLGLFWGSNFLFMKNATEYISTIQVVFLRISISIIPLIIYGIINKSYSVHHLKYWYHFLAMSLLAGVIYLFCFVIGSHLLYSGIAGSISGTVPIFTFILSLLFIKEVSITKSRSIGLLLGIIGIIVLSKPFDAEFDNNTLKGVSFMMIGALSFSASFIYARKFITPLKISGIALTTYQLVSATIILLFITPFSGIDKIFQNLTITIETILGLAILGTGISFLIYYYIIDKMGAVKAASVTYITPIVAIFIGVLVGKEPLNISDILGVVLILIGVYFLRRDK